MARGCAEELQAASKRVGKAIASGQQGGRPPNKNNDLGKASGSGQASGSGKPRALGARVLPIPSSNTNKVSTGEEEVSVPDGTALLKQLADAIEEYWGGGVTGSPTTNLHVAQEWAKAGVRTDLARPVFFELCKNLANQGKAPPSVRYFTAALHDRATQTQTTPEPPTRYGEPWATWRARLRGFDQTKLWIVSWGPDPTDPGCRLTKADLDQLRQEIAASHGQGGGK